MSNLSDITYDDGTHEVNYEQSLAYIPNELSPTTTGYAFSTGLTTPSASVFYQAIAADLVLTSSTVDPVAAFNELLSDYQNQKNYVGTDPNNGAFKIHLTMPNNLDDLMADFKKLLIADGYQVRATFPKGFIKAIGNAFAASNGIQLDANGNVNQSSGDWSVLFTAPPANLTAAQLNFYQDNSSNMALKFFNDFLALGQTYLIPKGSSSSAVTQLFGHLDNFLSTTNLLQTPDHAYINAGVPSDAYNHLTSFQDVFKLFGPSDPTGALFQARIKAFINQQLADKGYFSPSVSFKDWTTSVVSSNTDLIIRPSSSSLDGNSSEKMLILNRILALLIKLINTLQNVGIVQANRLRFLTQYQQAYTTLQTQIPVFLRNDGTPVGVTGGSHQTDASQDRNDLNSSFNANLVDNLRSLRGIQEDNAQKLQANINQTNDAVNQQTDMVTSFIQQLSTLLSSILR